jgi:hypothetical protein
LLLLAFDPTRVRSKRDVLHGRVLLCGENIAGENVLDLGRNRFEGRGKDLIHDPQLADLYLGGGERSRA